MAFKLPSWLSADKNVEKDEASLNAMPIDTGWETGSRAAELVLGSDKLELHEKKPLGNGKVSLENLDGTKGVTLDCKTGDLTDATSKEVTEVFTEKGAFKEKK